MECEVWSEIQERWGTSLIEMAGGHIFYKIMKGQLKISWDRTFDVFQLVARSHCLMLSERYVIDILGFNCCCMRLNSDCECCPDKSGHCHIERCENNHRYEDGKLIIPVLYYTERVLQWRHLARKILRIYNWKFVAEERFDWPYARYKMYFRNLERSRQLFSHIERDCRCRICRKQDTGFFFVPKKSCM